MVIGSSREGSVCSRTTEKQNNCIQEMDLVATDSIMIIIANEFDLIRTFTKRLLFIVRHLPKVPLCISKTMVA
jgi:hypothetical protein